MGVDTFAVLPGNVEVNVVAKVLGKLFGNGHRWGSSGNVRWIEVDTIEVKVYHNVPSMVSICGQDLTNVGKFEVYYHFESADGDHTGRHVSLGRSRAERLAVGKALVDFFGGYQIFRDCDHFDDPANRYEVPAKGPEENSPQDGGPWRELQRRISEVRAVSAKEIEMFKAIATYK